jgi:hypothetical protein
VSGKRGTFQTGSYMNDEAGLKKDTQPYFFVLMGEKLE